MCHIFLKKENAKLLDTKKKRKKKEQFDIKEEK